VPSAPSAGADDVAGFHHGPVPLAVATGAGAEMRQAMGVAVFAGMLGVTLFGLILTPVAYYLVRRWRTPSIASATRQIPEGAVHA